MEKKYLTLLIVILIAIIGFVFYFYKSSTPSNNIESGQYKILEIQLKVEAPFSTSALTVFQDGSALYSRNQEGEDEKKTIYESGSFTKLELETIFNIIYQNNFFSLKNKPYTEGSPLDGSAYTISVKAVSSLKSELADAFIYSVSCYEFNCDQEFLEIKELITDFFDEELLEVGV